MRLIMPLAVCLLISGCEPWGGADPFFYQYTRSQPDKQRLPGKYVPDAQSTARLGANTVPRYLQLNADGTFDTNFWPPSSSEVDTKATHGDWTLVRQQGNRLHPGE